MDQYREANRGLWDAWTRVNLRSEMYDVEAFAAGRGRDLDPIARAGPGDVRGKSLLHLQCHFGMDTIRWARHGATVTGIDFSEEAITAARALAARMGVPATFVQSDLYDLPSSLTGRFNVVFTSHGVLGWLPDLERWAQIVARYLAPGGVFWICACSIRTSTAPSPSARSTPAATARPTRRSRASSTAGCTRCRPSSARSCGPACGSSPSRSTRSSAGSSSPGWSRARTAGVGCPRMPGCPRAPAACR